MNEKSAAYERVTQLVETNGGSEIGRLWLCGLYEMRYSEGYSGEEIAKSLGIPWYVLHRWLVENAPDSIENAKSARTELKIDRVEKAMEEASIDDIALVKAQADFALKLGGKRYKAGYGEQNALSGVSKFGERGIVINITGVNSPYLKAEDNVLTVEASRVIELPVDGGLI